MAKFTVSACGCVFHVRQRGEREWLATPPSDLPKIYLNGHEVSLTSDGDAILTTNYSIPEKKLFAEIMAWHNAETDRCRVLRSVG